MTTFAGNDGVVKIGANAVAEVRSFNVTEVAETRDATSMGDTWRANKVNGLKSWTGSVTCWWDDTDTNGQVALTVGASVTLTLYPEGDGTGAYSISGTAIVTEISHEQAMEDTIEASFNFTGDGALTRGTV